jgi:hypothetical protein
MADSRIARGSHVFAPALQSALVRTLWVPCIYFVLAILMTWPLAAGIGERLPGLGDALQQTWILAWNAHILRTDPTAFWQAPIFYPYPDTAAYHDHHLVQTMLAAPLIWATGNPVLAHNLLVLFSFALTGWAVFLLARDVARVLAPAAPPAAQGWAAFAAGCAVTFSAYRMAHLVHLNLLQTAWLVFALVFLRRLLRPAEAGGGRWADAILLGLFTSLQIANAFYYGFFAIVLLGTYGLLWAIWALWRRLREGAPLPWGMLPRLVLAVTIAAIIAVPLLLPYLRIYSSLGIVRSLTEVDNWSAPLRAYISVPASNRLYGPLGELVVDSGEMVLFPGLLVTGLALLALGLGLRRRKAFEPEDRRGVELLFWALLAAGAALLSFGVALRLVRFSEPLPIPMPYPLLYAYLPGFGSMRVPARWGWLVTLALAVLAAVALARLLAHLAPPWRQCAGAAAVAAILVEQAAFPIPVTHPVLAELPPVYRWLGAPAQSDLTTIVELPIGPTPRGAELERIIWRHFYSLHHWKRQPIAYGALIPFGTLELMRRLQDLPDPAALGYLQLIGVDTLVLHRDEYDSAELAALIAGLEAAPAVMRRGEVGDSLIYSLAPLGQLNLPPGSIAISNDERMPGLPVLGLIRRWQDEGRTLYGPGRPRFYAPLAALAPGQPADYGLLASSEEPAVYGYSAEARVWEQQGLTLYRRDPTLLAALRLGAVDRGQFHPRYPSRLTLYAGLDGLRVDEQQLRWEEQAVTIVVELDLASLGGELRVGSRAIPVPTGLSTLRLPLQTGETVPLAGDAEALAMLRLRVVHGAEDDLAVGSTPGLAATAEARFEGGLLTVRARAAGGPGLLLDIRGARASDDRPIKLLAGVQPVEPDRELRFEVDPLRPQASWLLGSEPPEDGRYIAYLKDQAVPDGAGQPVAQFRISGGQIVDFTGVPLPLTVVP